MSTFPPPWLVRVNNIFKILNYNYERKARQNKINVFFVNER